MTSLPPYNTKRLTQSAIGFTRVSTGPQALDSDSLAAQADKIRAHASARGLQLLAIYEETGSAWTRPFEERADAVDALAHARAVSAVFIVARADRLTRRKKDVPSIFEYGVEIHVCDGQPAARIGRKSFTKMTARAQAEAENKSRAQSAASKSASGRKRMSPSTPEGRRRGHLSASLRQQENIWRVRNFALANPGFCEIAMARRVDQLNDAHLYHVKSIRNPRGALWTPNALRRLWPCILEDIALQMEDELVT